MKCTYRLEKISSTTVLGRQILSPQSKRCGTSCTSLARKEKVSTSHPGKRCENWDSTMLWSSEVGWRMETVIWVNCCVIITLWRRWAIVAGNGLSRSWRNTGQLHWAIYMYVNYRSASLSYIYVCELEVSLTERNTCMWTTGSNEANWALIRHSCVQHVGSFEHYVGWCLIMLAWD